MRNDYSELSNCENMQPVSSEKVSLVLCRDDRKKAKEDETKGKKT